MFIILKTNPKLSAKWSLEDNTTANNSISGPNKNIVYQQNKLFQPQKDNCGKKDLLRNNKSLKALSVRGYLQVTNSPQ